MNDVTDLDEGSVVEYSLAELGFVLVFVLLLLSGWEINTNAANLKKEAESRADIERQLEAEKKENAALKAQIAWLPPEQTEFPDDFMFVKKVDYLDLQARVDYADQVIKDASILEKLPQPLIDIITETASSPEAPPEDPLIVSETDLRLIEERLDSLKQENARMSDELARMSEKLAANKEDASPPSADGGGKVGTRGFCTYEPPKSDSDQVFGKSVALGTLLIEEDGITLLAKNSAIERGSFVDIAGEDYDTALVAEILRKWPLNQKLSPRQFQTIGAKYVDIGDLPSEKRVACRFGMDYYVPIYSKKSASMLKDIMEGSFYRNVELSEANFAKRFPAIKSTLKDTITEAAQSNREPQQNNLPKTITKPKIISKTMPKYPSNAKRREIKGIVEIRYIVSTNGRATEMEIIREEPLNYGFGKASLAALKKYRFEPATENGKPVRSEVQKLRFRF